MVKEHDFDEKNINKQELQKYESKYSENKFLEKITKYGKDIGLELIFKAVNLWYVLQKPEVPATTKALIMGALGYLISPLDFVPDLLPLLGYTDDLVAVTFALIQIQGYIDGEVKEKSRNFLKGIFGEEAVKNL